ncbi:alpha/beta hydrolase [Dietzia timorensis]|uniref:Protein PS1 n=1 Tax=Dietzia timorensis TaxID=499555 RepID=A0A173LIE4_9ACTN|nr:alpha/beta hydrolase-fold protein [Dietzia timorensis]ANI91057.1 Protein PS1 [Dietzia timorensis]
MARLTSAGALAAAVALLASTAFSSAPIASAQSELPTPAQGNNQPWLGDQAHIVKSENLGGNFHRVHVWSPANREVVVNEVISAPGGQARPTFYLLPGIKGSAIPSDFSWSKHTDVRSFFADKNVNVVMPIGGPHSAWTDWDFPDPVLGVNKWNTYMESELPGLIDGAFNGTGRDAIGGLSSTGGAALDIAAHAPQRFRAAASYSGCPIRSGAAGIFSSGAIMASGGGNPFNAWGQPFSQSWPDHDPNANPGRLRDVKVFVSSGSGVPGPIDEPQNQPYGGLNLWTGPAVVEAGVNGCTEVFANNARAAGVDVNRYYMPQGSHSFPLFGHSMRTSWNQTIAGAIGA